MGYQLHYHEVLGENPSGFYDNTNGDGSGRPVERVSWFDTEAFCQKLSRLTGKVYRLPSEVEWEYACRAGTTTPFALGETLTTGIANFNGNFAYAGGPKCIYRKMTVAVDSFPPNAFGLYNMHGNVHEWCADDYRDSYDGAPSDASPWLGRDAENRKILRGGSWIFDANFCRSAYRYWQAAGNRNSGIGFRVVCAFSA